MGLRSETAGTVARAVLLAAIGLGLAAFGTVGVTTPAEARDPDKITVGVIPIIDVAPIYLGKAKGFFAQQDLDPDLKLAQGGAAFVPSVISGQYEFGFSNVTTLVIAAAKGLELVSVANGAASTGSRDGDYAGLFAPADGPIKTAKDLEGRTIAVNNLQNIGDTTVRQAMRVAGGDPSKVKFVELAFPDMLPALAAKRIDAAWLVEPFVTLAKDQGARNFAWNLIDVSPHTTVATYFTSARYVQTHADLVKRFKTAMDQSLVYASSHPDEVRQIVLTYTKIPPAIVSRITLPTWPTQIDRASCDALADLAIKDGLITAKPDMAKLFP